jgi:hypothetical protein
MRVLALAIMAGFVVASSADARRLKFANEVHIEQAHGRVSADSTTSANTKPRGTPEGGVKNADSAAKGSPSIPTTCSQQNASSPACYSATQQARPVGR